MNEIWKELKENKNYFISNFGNFKNKYNKILKLNINKRGYLYCNISTNGHVTKIKIHRLVALYFIKNIKNKDTVNHIDGNKSNNHYSNLEWCDSLYNNIYGTRCQRQAEKMKVSIKQYSLTNVFIKEYTSIKEAGKETNNNPNNISNCLSGRAKTSGGYIWKY